jgi:SPP1 family predicted phage head-tail adaptor
MVVKIKSGDLTRKVVFQQPTSSLNDQKEKTLTLTDAFTTFAAVKKFNKNRTTEAHATALIGSLDFYVRSSTERQAVTEDWLIAMDGKDYVIHEIEPVDMEDSKETFLRFTAKAKQ